MKTISDSTGKYHIYEVRAEQRSKNFTIQAVTFKGNWVIPIEVEILHTCEPTGPIFNIYPKETYVCPQGSL